MTDFYEIGVEARAARMREMALEALKSWGITDCQPQLIKIRENTVFRVTTADGTDAALRIHRYGYHSDAALQSELSWMRALYRDGIEVPEIVAPPSGALFITSTVESVPERRQVDMVKWLKGEPLGSLEEGLSSAVDDIHRVFAEVGRLVARLHNHAANWQPPPGFVRHAWDVDGLTGEAPLWGRFWEFPDLDKAQRALIERVRHVARSDLIAIDGDSQGYGLIHADFNFDNILLHDGRITAIDFDDCGFGWHLFDLATLSIMFRGSEDFDTVCNAVIEGYRRERPLSDEMLEQMPLFYLVRGLTYLGWIHTRSETKTARDITAEIVDSVCQLAEEYMSGRGPAEGQP